MSQVIETRYILYLVEGVLLSIQQAAAGNRNVCYFEIRNELFDLKMLGNNIFP
jgi:hypothetical protein